MIRIDFNAASVFDQLDRARRVLDDMKPVYEEIGDYVVEQTEQRFLTGKAPDGARWRKKRPATLAAYLARGDGDRPRPLIGASERLKNSIVQFASRDAVEIGSGVEYSAVMQHGAKKGAFGKTRTNRPIPWGEIPARPFLGLSPDDERVIIEIVDEHIGDAIGD